MNFMWHGTDLNPTRIPPCPVSCGFQGSSRGSKRRRPHGWATMSRCGLPCNSMRTASMSSKLRSETEMIWHHWNLVLKCFEQFDIQRKRNSIHLIHPCLGRTQDQPFGFSADDHVPRLWSNKSSPWHGIPGVSRYPNRKLEASLSTKFWIKYVIQNQLYCHTSSYFHIFCFGKWKWHVVACSCCVSVVRWPTMTNINAGPHLWHDRHWHQLPKTETSPRNVQRWSSFYSPSCFWDLLRPSEIFWDSLWRLYDDCAYLDV